MCRWPLACRLCAMKVCVCRRGSRSWRRGWWRWQHSRSEPTASSREMGSQCRANNRRGRWLRETGSVKHGKYLDLGKCIKLKKQFKLMLRHRCGSFRLQKTRQSKTFSWKSEQQIVLFFFFPLLNFQLSGNVGSFTGSSVLRNYWELHGNFYFSNTSCADKAGKHIRQFKMLNQLKT